MPPTDTAVRAAKPTEKPRKLADDRGLYLLVNSSGIKQSRFKYRVGGKEKRLAFGAYPDLSLKAAPAPVATKPANRLQPMAGTPPWRG